MCKQTVAALQAAQKRLQGLQRDFGKDPGCIESRTETYIEAGVKLRAYETVQLYRAAKEVNEFSGASIKFGSNIKTMFNWK